MKKNGYLITIEGIDGSGKSTLCSALAQELTQKNYTVLVTREPGGSALGKHLRTIVHQDATKLDPKAEYLLFAADRAEHIATVVQPALEKGQVVISDRMGDSSLAYQGYGRGIDCTMIELVNRWAMNGLTPQTIMYVKIPIEIALERIKKTRPQLTSFELEAAAFWRRVSDGFDTIFKDKKNVITLDGTLPTETLVTIILAELSDKLPPV